MADASSVAVFERDYVRPVAGRTLVVGSALYTDREDRRKRYPDAIGVDMQAGAGVDVIGNMEEALPGLFTFAHVDCVSVLEHSRRPWLLAENIERLLMPGGSLFVTVPFCWRIHSYPNDYWRMTPEGLMSLFPNIVWTKVMLAHQTATEKMRLPAVKVEGFPYFPRTETVAFGHRK